MNRTKSASRRTASLLPAVCLSLLPVLTFAACRHQDYRRNEGMIWHTAYHIAYSADRDMADSIMATLGEVDASLNAFNPRSTVSRVNSADSAEVDRHFRTVYEESLRVHRMSAGAFDPTLGPLITAWGFGKGHKATADTLRIDSLLALTGITRTRIENDRLIKPDRKTEFNFSAIAKGYGCDQVAEMLERNGITDYLVEIGGEIRCRGKSPNGGKWRVSIDKPVKSDKPVHDPQCVIGISGPGMATSGNYRNFHKESGGTYGHTISSKSGRPVQTDVLSATVVSSTAMEADALATAMMAMGSEAALQLADSLDAAAMLVLDDFSVRETPRFSALKAASGNSTPQ